MDGEISPGDVKELLDAGADVRVVDIRSPESFRRAHIPGSENLPMNRLPQQVERLSGADHVVTVCPHGKASVQAANLVKSYEGTADATVESMAGGLAAWEWDLVASDDADADGETAGATDAPF